MEKINYQLETDKAIERLCADGRRERLLLHACCAPCSSYVLEYLTKAGGGSKVREMLPAQDVAHGGICPQKRLPAFCDHADRQPAQECSAYQQDRL